MSNTKDGYVTVFETSDGGTGDPLDTLWQFFVDNQPVTTKNERHAETARLAIKTATRVQVTYDSGSGNTISQIRMEFRYVCTEELIRDCHNSPPPPEGSRYICETKRYSRCHPGTEG